MNFNGLMLASMCVLKLIPDQGKVRLVTFMPPQSAMLDQSIGAADRALELLSLFISCCDAFSDWCFGLNLQRIGEDCSRNVILLSVLVSLMTMSMCVVIFIHL